MGLDHSDGHLILCNRRRLLGVNWRKLSASIAKEDGDFRYVIYRGDNAGKERYNIELNLLIFVAYIIGTYSNR